VDLYELRRPLAPAFDEKSNETDLARQLAFSSSNCKALVPGVPNRTF
jgi:hypothetical protein